MPILERCPSSELAVNFIVVLCNGQLCFRMGIALLHIRVDVTWLVKPETGVECPHQPFYFSFLLWLMPDTWTEHDVKPLGDVLDVVREQLFAVVDENNIG